MIVGFQSPLPEIRRPLASRLFNLSGTMSYWGKNWKFLVPKEFRSDLGSVPWLVRWLVPSDGKYEAAFILHDFCIEDLKKRAADPFRSLNPYSLDGPLIDGRQTDEQLRDSLGDLDAPFVMRWLIWTGVRWAAPFNKARRSGGVVADLPMMLLWTILALPILLIGTIPMLLALGLYFFLEGCISAWVVLFRHGTT